MSRSLADERMALEDRILEAQKHHAAAAVAEFLAEGFPERWQMEDGVSSGYAGSVKSYFDRAVTLVSTPRRGAMVS